VTCVTSILTKVGENKRTDRRTMSSITLYDQRTLGVYKNDHHLRLEGLERSFVKQIHHNSYGVSDFHILYRWDTVVNQIVYSISHRLHAIL